MCDNYVDHDSDSEHKLWDPIQALNHCKVVIVLNQKLVDTTAVLIEELWEKAVLRIAVDGGLAQLHELNNESHSYIPDIISGDFDSITTDLLNLYAQKGSEIIHTPDQNETDFTKALKVCFKRISSKNLDVQCIFALGENGERLDHTFGNLNTLYKASEWSPLPIYYVGKNTISWLLNSGKHKIVAHKSLQDSHIGLIPLGEPCSSVTTTGLKWNLCNGRMEFGHLISCCNKFDTESYVTIENDKNLIWTMELNLQCVKSMSKL